MSCRRKIINVINIIERSNRLKRTNFSENRSISNMGDSNEEGVTHMQDESSEIET